MYEWIDKLREPDGLIRRDEALRAGTDPDEIMKALRTGRIKRLQRGYYVAREDEVGPLALARAAVLASGIPDAVASHHTAARVHGIPLPAGQAPEHVTVLRNQRRTRRRELVFHGRSMGLGEVQVIGGIPVTTVSRTLIDLAETVPELHAVWAIDDTLRRGLVDRSELTAAVRGRRAAPGAGRVTDRLRAADGIAESILETAGRLALASAGLPLPTPQYEVIAEGMVVARLDGAYPAQRLGLEFDGAGTHDQPDALFRDRWRQNRLLELGWTVLRFTWWDVLHGRESFVRSVRSAVQDTG